MRLAESEAERGHFLEAAKHAATAYQLRGAAPLEPDDLEVAIREHGEWVERWSKPFVGAARALTRWQNRNRS